MHTPHPNTYTVRYAHTGKTNTRTGNRPWHDRSPENRKSLTTHLTYLTAFFAANIAASAEPPPVPRQADGNSATLEAKEHGKKVIRSLEEWYGLPEVKDLKAAVNVKLRDLSKKYATTDRFNDRRALDPLATGIVDGIFSHEYVPLPPLYREFQNPALSWELRKALELQVKKYKRNPYELPIETINGTALIEYLNENLRMKFIVEEGHRKPSQPPT